MTTCWNKSCPLGKVQGLKEGYVHAFWRKVLWPNQLAKCCSPYLHHTQEKGNGEVNNGNLTLKYHTASKLTGFYSVKGWFTKEFTKHNCKYNVTYLIKAQLANSFLTNTKCYEEGCSIQVNNIW